MPTATRDLDATRGARKGDAPVRRVALSGGVAFAVYIAGAGVAYVSQLLIARLAGIEAYGIYAYVLAWMTVLAYLAAAGFDVALLRFIPAYRVAGTWPLLRGIERYAVRTCLLVSAVVIGAGLVLDWVQAAAVSAELRRTFALGLLLVPALALLWQHCSVLRAYGAGTSAVAIDRLLREGVVIALVLAWTLWLGAGVGAPFVMLATVIGAGAGLALALFMLRRLRPRELDGVPAAYDRDAWRPAALLLAVITVVDVLMNRTGVLVLGWLGDTNGAGIFSLVFNIAFLIILPRTAVNTLFAPMVSDLAARNEKERLQRLVTGATLLTIAVSVPIGIALLLLADPILSWFGPDFARGAQTMRILVIGQLLIAAFGSQLHVLAMTGKEVTAAALLTSSAALNLAATLALAPALGLEGAAIAATAVAALCNLALAAAIYRQVGLLPGVVDAVLRLRTGAALASRQGLT
jgi:O-antigen/teichoic acid export membrane protein